MGTQSHSVPDAAPLQLVGVLIIMLYSACVLFCIITIGSICKAQPAQLNLLEQNALRLALQVSKSFSVMDNLFIQFYNENPSEFKEAAWRNIPNNQLKQNPEYREFITWVGNVPIGHLANYVDAPHTATTEYQDIGRVLRQRGYKKHFADRFWDLLTRRLSFGANISSAMKKLKPFTLDAMKSQLPV